MEKKQKFNPIDEKATCKNIKQIMDKKNISPKEVQEALNLGSIQAVYKWISPKMNAIPSTENLVLLAQLFECSLDDILVYRSK